MSAVLTETFPDGTVALSFDGGYASRALAHAAGRRRLAAIRGES